LFHQKRTDRPSAVFTAIEQGKRRFEKGDAMMRTHVSRSATTSNAIADRTVLRSRLEETRSAFHAVVEQLTDADWHRKTSSTAWTIGEVLAHLAYTLAHTPEAIEHVRQGKNYHNPPSFLSWLGHLINRRLAQQSARGQTRASILVWYDTAHTSMLATVEGIGDDEWGRGAHCFGSGYKTILDLCQMLPTHFQEHAAQIAASK
jgi:DinB family protein